MNSELETESLLREEDSSSEKTEHSYAFCYIVLNAGEYLDFSLASITKLMRLNENSQIIIVEGADKFSHYLEKTEDGLSIDDTSKIVKKWLELYDERIIYHKFGHVETKKVLRNKCLDIARYQSNYGSEFIFNVDGDELIKVEDFLELDKLIAKNPNVISFWLKQYLFWGDFGKRYVDEGSGYKELVFANTLNINYEKWHTQVSINENPPIISHMPECVMKVEVPYYHYGYITSMRRLWMRRLYTYCQNTFYERVIDKNFNWSGAHNAWELFWRGQPWQNKHTIELVDFELNDHPEEIKSHLWFNLSNNEIWDCIYPYPTFTGGI